MRRWILVLPLLAIASPAWALKPGKHRALLEQACSDAGLPGAFCRRAGKAVYETDANEWTDLSAHAQRELGQDRCTAADAAASRVDALARAMVDDAAAGQLEDAAIALGRAVHTLQDECAHHGMTNQEHAFYSLTMTCTGAQVSPDVTADAIACAQTRTRDALAAAATALAQTSWVGVDQICLDFNDQDSCELATLPTPFQACDFLAEYKDWDGVDSTWNGAIVGPALVDAFADGLAGAPVSRSICAGDAAAIDPPAPKPTVTDRTAGCPLASIGCFGKVDGEDDAPAMDAGCASGRGGGWLVVALVALASRRRASSR